MFTLVICITQSSIFAKDGAGGRGGGTGVICKTGDSEHIYLLEEYSLLRDGYQINFPPSRNQVLRFMEIRLASQPEFFHKWKMIWEAIGSYENWSEYSLGDDPDFTNTSLYPRVAREHYRKTFLMAYNYQYFDLVSQGMLNEKDDLAIVHDQCQKVSLSVIIDNLVFKYSPRILLSERTKRMLEVHESLFFLGIHEYSHIFATNTQDLIKTINNGQQVDLAHQKFEHSAVENNIQKINGFYVSTSSKNNCPQSISYLFETKDRFIVHNPLKTLSMYEHASADYQDKKDIPLPLGKIEIQSEEGFYSLHFDKNDYLHQFNEGHYAVYKNGKRVCTYEREISGDKIRTLKFLNRISNYKHIKF